ncbi:cell wall hydrolase [Sphingomonas aurea]|uniref:cell wall hydrolase n=1 Tax=Sphingomonas aurea TaxID=3063994 RepID=UPI00351D7114
MARRRTGRRRGGNGRRQRAGAAEYWLLLLGITVFIVAGVGILGPWRFAAAPPPNVARPMTMAEARASNAKVAVQWRRRSRAEPYRFRGGPAARAQAVDCLATAALYEIGGDARGQRAVMQVILNRVRAPGFPRTICGVVYQGAARATGCQFSFTCDGSVRRRPIRLGWAAARRAANRALSGRVFAPVGRATHYHADWVVPYWRPTLTKVARVGPHLFYQRR